MYSKEELGAHLFSCWFNNINYVAHNKKEKFDIYIGRPSGFGNPFTISNNRTRLGVVQRYYDWVMDEKLIYLIDEKGNKYSNFWVRENLHTLKGKILGCWCAPQLCHGHVLAELANES